MVRTLVGVGVLLVLLPAGVPAQEPRAPRLEQDFREVALGKLPEGWGGRGVFAVLKDAAGRPSLQTTAKAGTPPLTIPGLPLHGDLFVEVEFAVGVGQELRLRLEGLGLGAAVGVAVDRGGSVTLADLPARPADKFKLDDVNVLRLTREAGVYRAVLNGSVAAAGQLPYKGPFDTLQLSLTAGGSNRGEVVIYSVKAGLLGMKGAREEPAGTVLLAEDFTMTDEGRLPKGWDGRGVFAVAKGASGCRFLRPTATTGVPPVTLPPLALRGNFFVDVEYASGVGQELRLRLEGLGLGAAVPVVIDRAGNVTLGDQVARAPKGPFHLDAVNRLRLERDGDRYVVRLNDIPVTEAVLPYTGDFDTVQLYFSAPGSNIAEAGVYSVKAGVLGLAREPAKPVGKVLLSEDFAKVPEGDLPKGWAERGSHAVDKDEGGRASLFTTAKKDVPLCVLPAVELKGNYFVDCEFRIGVNQALRLQLEGAGAKVDLTIDRGGNTTLADQAARPAKVFHLDAVNRLRLERDSDRYIVRLNDAVVVAAVLPAKDAAFTKVGLELPPGESNVGVARVYSIRVGVLDAPRP